LSLPPSLPPSLFFLFCCPFSAFNQEYGNPKYLIRFIPNIKNFELADKKISVEEV